MKKEVLVLIFLGVCSYNSMAQFNWEHTEGPPGALLAYLYTNDKYAFVPQVDFLFRSDDAIHWQKVERTFSGHLAIHKDTMVSPFYDDSLKKMMLQISFNNGESWIIKSVPDGIQNYGSIVLCQHGLYWHQYHGLGLYKSSDLGDSWDTIPQHILYDYDLAVFDERVYAYDLLSMWRTDENGNKWEEIELPSAQLQFQYMDDFVVQDSNIIFTTEDYIFHSLDGGSTWNQLTMYSANSHDKLTLVGSSIYADIYNTFLRSNDYGFHWDTLISGDHYPKFIELGGLKNTFLCTTYNTGVFRWENSSHQLIESNDGLGKAFVYDLNLGSNKIWAACGNGVFAYDIINDTWGPKMNFPEASFEYENVTSNENNWVAASEIYKSHFFLSKDGGASWDTIRTDYYIDNLQLLGNNIFISSDSKGTYRSVDEGKNWEQVHYAFNDDEFVPFDNKNYLPGYNKLFYTADDGLTFQSIDCPINIRRLSSFENQLYALTVDSLDFIHLYISTDAMNWISASNGFPELDGVDFLNWGHSFFFRDADHYFAFLEDVGVYWSPIDEISWSPYYSMFFGNHWLIKDDILYMSDRGLYKTDILNPYTSIDPINAGNPSTFELSPNPVSEIIHIVFDPESNSSGKLNIYSLDGVLQYAKVITRDEKEINISLQNYPASLYYVVFVGKDRVESHPCLKL